MSLIKKDLYFLDTVNATRIYDNYMGTSSYLNVYHSYNCYFPFNTSIRNVKKNNIENCRNANCITNCTISKFIKCF